MNIVQSGFTQEEASGILQLSPSQVYKLIKQDRLNLSELAGRPIILLEDEKNRRFFEERRKYLEARGLLKPQPEPASK